jgi:hypothetical protein
MRNLILTIGFVLGVSEPSHAQWVVNDPAVTYRNSVTAVLKEVLLRLQQQQHSELRRMAQRLSMFTTLAKFRVPDPPRWRIHDFEGPAFLYARDYHAALNYGDSSGRAFLAVSHPVADAAPALGRLSPQARRTLLSQLATLDLSDSAVISATHDTGQLRYNGRRELAAIDALERDVTNDSLEQSSTAVLDKVSGAGLIAARQRQARIQILDGIVEQLLVEGKRTRDTETAAMNMQLTGWRDRAAVNQAFAAGAGDALRTWRQP